MNEYETITLQKIKFAIVQHVYPQDMKFKEELDVLNQRMTQILTYNLLGKSTETKIYPSTWWDAFKDRWYPRWLRKWFPVNYDSFTLYNICPHIDIEYANNPKVHLQFLGLKETPT